MHQFELCIVKVTAFCNLNCSYCYMFNAGDRTFERVPKAMSSQVSLALLERITEYLDLHGSRRFHLTLHGGEPTLWSQASLAAFLERVRQLNARGYLFSISMQTNALRYDPAWYALLAEHQVSIGVSLDGPRVINDQRRVTHGGAGSYERVMSTVDQILAGPARHNFQGFLSVANPAMDAGEFVDWIASLPVTRMDLLWPMEFSHGNPPWPEKGEEAYRAAPRYGRWFGETLSLLCNAVHARNAHWSRSRAWVGIRTPRTRFAS